MGTLKYPLRGILPIRIDDRTLAHLQIVIGSKLRLRQAFFFSWVDDIQSGSGRTSVWIDSAIPLTLAYDSNQRQQINRAWLEALMATANSPGGLHLVTEPDTLRIAEPATHPGKVAA